MLTISRSKKKLVSAAIWAVGVFVCLLTVRGQFTASSGFELPLYLFCCAAGAVAVLFCCVELPEHLTKNLAFSTVIALVSAVPIFTMMEAIASNTLKELYTISILFNFLVIWLLVWLVLSVSRRFCFALRSVAVLCYILAVANDMVQEFRGQPISALDLYSLRTAASVADRYVYSFGSGFWTGTMLLLLVWAFSGFAKGRLRGVKTSCINLAVCLVCQAAFWGSFYKTSMLEKLGISDYLWNQKLAFQDNGVLLSLFYSTRYLMIDVPKGYSADRADQLLTDASDSYVQTVTDQRPNIIAVMNESFADLDLVGDLNASEDPLAYYHSLAGSENTITGDLLVSTFGGGTCNTEFEFLSGCSMAFFPAGSVVYQQYITSELPNLTTTLTDQGYTAFAVHPFYAYCWNRDEVYPLLGFDYFLDINNFEGARTMGGYMGNSVCDESDYEKLFELYEAKEPDERLFIFNVTMQNHGGYSQISGCDENVTLDGYSKQYTSAENYLSLVRESDKQLETLLEYFSQVDEPTIVVFFGDHQPNLSDEFYNELYGIPEEERTLSQIQNKYKTPFLIWANYDIGSEQLGTISANYLSTLVLEKAGLEMPEFNQFLSQLYKQVPAVNLNGYQTPDGIDHSFEEETDVTELLREYQTIQYNLMFGKADRVESGFTIAG